MNLPVLCHRLRSYRGSSMGKGSSRFAPVEVQVSEMGHVTLFTHPHPIPCEKQGIMPASTSTMPSLLFYVQFPKAAPTPCSPRYCLLALALCLPRLSSIQGVQLFLVPVKPFPSLGRQLCLLTSTGMKVEELRLRECSPGCFPGTC